METVEVLEQRIGRLRVAVREAVVAGDTGRARTLRVELKKAEEAWEAALAGVEGDVPHEDDGSGSAAGPPASTASLAIPLLPLREQVHQALSLLTVPAAPRLIAAVHGAFFSSAFPTARVTSLRRDEERSFRTAPYARPYYVCAALTADLLAPARGLLAISTWPVERRVIGPLSSRVDFLTAAIQVAEAAARLPGSGLAAGRLAWRFAASIPGAAESASTIDLQQVARAAQAELHVHAAADLRVRRSAAQRARRQLDDAAQLFGSRLHASRGSASGGTAS